MAHLNDNERMILKSALDRAIGASKTWSETAHETFVRMAEAARENVVTKGDFSFIRNFRMQFGIREQTQTINDRTLETQFNIMMEPIYTHFLKFRADYERDRKRSLYMEMLRSGRKDEFIQIMRSHLGVHTADTELTQRVWQEFHAEEKAKQQQEEQRGRMEAHKRLTDVMNQRNIEREAKRRLEQMEFERAVGSKMEELKGQGGGAAARS